jgi:hypothetical protein
MGQHSISDLFLLVRDWAQKHIAAGANHREILATAGKEA